jgi:hypothetical protein
MDRNPLQCKGLTGEMNIESAYGGQVMNKECRIWKARSFDSAFGLTQDDVVVDCRAAPLRGKLGRDDRGFERGEEQGDPEINFGANQVRQPRPQVAGLTDKERGGASRSFSGPSIRPAASLRMTWW